jgi:chemotaxis protein CheD
MSFQLVNVGIADIKVAVYPDVLRTILGSCVGICLYDEKAKVIGLAHIMLAEQNISGTNPKKYADSAIPILIDEMRKAGANTEQLNAKIVGGSAMFNVPAGGIMGDIGRNNVKKVKEVLAQQSIKIIAEDTGGDFGRTIDFFSLDGSVKVKSLGKDEKVL